MPETTPLILGNVTKPGAADRLQRAGQAALQSLDERTSMHVGQVVGNDIDHIRIDLTGIRIDSVEDFEDFGDRVGEAFRSHGIEERRLDPVHASPGLVKLAEIRARPATVLGAPYVLDGALVDVPITWLEDAGGLLAIAIDEHRDPLHLTGELSLRVEQDALIDSLHVLVEQLSDREDVPVRVQLRQVRFTQETPRSVRVEASAKVSKGFVSGTAIAKATLELDHELVFHTREIDITSKNPIIAGFLKLAENHLRVKPMRLADLGPLGERIIDVTVTVGDEIEARAVLG
ncbi:MAG TPA: hypothetical protein H9830_11980 [Candidatus Agrococcus pullicola]|uniref:Uncharacterized protein n=1 Tax=Candidatus Agrococcus pullicola TaxID=2838429 RepID=A0A9D1YWD4_9MICO|nr:hypothetical protein [Candidatus Agrococcus pullicola]